MLTVSALLAILYFFHLAQQNQVLLLDYLVPLLLLEFASSDLVLAQLLFQLEIPGINNLFLVLDIVLGINDPQALLMLLVRSAN